MGSLGRQVREHSSSSRACTNHSDAEATLIPTRDSASCLSRSESASDVASHGARGGKARCELAFQQGAQLPCCAPCCYHSIFRSANDAYPPLSLALLTSTTARRAAVFLQVVSGVKPRKNSKRWGRESPEEDQGRRSALPGESEVCHGRARASEAQKVDTMLAGMPHPPSQQNRKVDRKRSDIRP